MSNKLKIWDTRLISDTYTITAQMQAQIDAIVEQTGVSNLESLPHSMIPTASLYEILICYAMLYNRVLDADLLNTGNAKQTQLKELH
jgi:hypothetical protein